jgi:2-polyprenyl-3-methyl-5-hydroxy-6-metoxy-1,4-benzoquinol methylase
MITQNTLIAESWLKNASAWVDAVREGRIPSRRAGTDAAAVSAVLDNSPRRVLDAGCGEGWLARYLAQHGIHVTGFDGSDALIRRAREVGGADYLHVTYDSFVERPSVAGSDFDVVVFNFSLFAEDIVPTLGAARHALRPGGHLVIQTVHPFNDAQGEAYMDGWRVETFSSMSTNFETPMPWFFRTMETWVRSVVRAGFFLKEVREPVNHETGKPLSLLLIASS